MDPGATAKSMLFLTRGARGQGEEREKAGEGSAYMSAYASAGNPLRANIAVKPSQTLVVAAQPDCITDSLVSPRPHVTPRPV